MKDFQGLKLADSRANIRVQKLVNFHSPIYFFWGKGVPL
jgi:hypothetical protein